MSKKKKIPATLSKASDRALEEANIRNSSKTDKDLPPELGGRDGPEPTRFGDWEKKGLISDF
jgi:hypothetical protein